MSCAKETVLEKSECEAISFSSIVDNISLGLSELESDSKKSQSHVSTKAYPSVISQKSEKKSLKKISKKTPIENMMLWAFCSNNVQYIGSNINNKNYGIKLNVEGHKVTYDNKADFAYWPEKEQLNFYALVPYSVAKNSFNGIKNGCPSFVFGQKDKETSDSNSSPIVDGKTDILFSNNAKGLTKRDTYVSLKFHHILTKISFKLDEKIKSKIPSKKGIGVRIIISNVCSKAKFSLSNNNYFSSRNEFTQRYYLDYYNNKDGIDIDNKALYLLPQKLNGIRKKNNNSIPPATITLSCYDPESGWDILAENIPFPKNETWKAGTHVIYTLTLKGEDIILEPVVSGYGESSQDIIKIGYTLNVTKPHDFTYKGGEHYMNVESYYEDGTIEHGVSNKISCPSHLEYKNENGEWSNVVAGEKINNWLSCNDYNSNKIAIKVDHSQIDKTINTHTKVLRSVSPKGSKDNPYDLSTHDYEGNVTLRNTANCYVINAPGWYKFPAVYGNAIKDGRNNVAAYLAQFDSKNYHGGKYDPTGKHVLKHMVDYKDNPITQPYIEGGKYVSELWVEGTTYIYPLTYNEEDKCIEFYVYPEYITQSNIVFALVDNYGETMWSWHIWVTDANIPFTHSVKNTHGVYDFMRVNLGWINNDDYVNYYPERSQEMRVVQDDSGKTSEFTIIQHSKSISSINASGTSSIYQWGRKDPLSATKGFYGEYKYPDQICGQITPTSNFSIGYSIKNPDKFINVYSLEYKNWSGKECYINFWNNGEPFKASTHIKTVYDPCPVGFHVPTWDAMEDFIKLDNSYESIARPQNVIEYKGRSSFYFDDGYDENEGLLMPWVPHLFCNGQKYEYDCAYWSSDNKLLLDDLNQHKFNIDEATINNGPRPQYYYGHNDNDYQQGLEVYFLEDKICQNHQFFRSNMYGFAIRPVADYKE